MSNCFYCLYKIDKQFGAIAWQSNEIVALVLPDQTAAQAKRSILKKNPDAQETTPTDFVNELLVEIKNYFAGTDANFKPFKLSFSGMSEFTRIIYKTLKRIPPGETLSYSELATLAGKKGSARAVGTALKNNPLPLIIPCHRVVKSNYDLGEFNSSAGASTKARMLSLEGLKLDGYKISKAKTFSDIDIHEAIRYLSEADTQLGKFIEKAPKFNLETNPAQSTFHSLCEAVVYQQLTGKAAATIFSRLMGLYGKPAILRPFDVVRTDFDELRKVGLSRNKALAIQSLAESAISKNLPDVNKLRSMQNYEIIRVLTRIKGIGKWTAEMFLIFRLGRTDVLSTGDLGLQKGLAKIRKTNHLPSPVELGRQGKTWMPYRSIASWYLWRAAETRTISK